MTKDPIVISILILESIVLVASLLIGKWWFAGIAGFGIMLIVLIMRRDRE